MNALSLRAVPAAMAAACLALGRGRRLAFNSGEERVHLTLGPRLMTDMASPQRALHLLSQHGTLLLSNADALLSLCSEVPVITRGPSHDWYWQLINQQLGRTLRDLLSPLEPGTPSTPALPERIDCRISSERSGEQAHGVLSCSAATLLRLFDAAPWHCVERPLPADWPLRYPLVMGRMNLTVSQLRSLRPGDVLLPEKPLFNVHGAGRVQLGNQVWAAHSPDQDEPLQLQLIHKENAHDQ